MYTRFKNDAIWKRIYEIDTFFSLIKTFLFDEKTKVYVLQVLGLL